MKLNTMYNIDEVMSAHLGLCEDACIELLRLSLVIAESLRFTRDNTGTLPMDRSIDKLGGGDWDQGAIDSVLELCDLCDYFGTTHD